MQSDTAFERVEDQMLFFRHLAASGPPLAPYSYSMVYGVAKAYVELYQVTYGQKPSGKKYKDVRTITNTARKAANIYNLIRMER